MGPLEERRDRRNAAILLDDNYRAECFRRRGSRQATLLTEEQFEPWLNGEAGEEYLKPAPDDFLQKWPVSQRVNSSKAPTDDPSLIEKTAA